MPRKPSKEIAAKPKCPHRPVPDFGYPAWHLDAQERHKRGERQRQCGMCGLWIWSSFWGPCDWPTKDKDVCIVGRVKDA